MCVGEREWVGRVNVWCSICERKKRKISFESASTAVYLAKRTYTVSHANNHSKVLTANYKQIKCNFTQRQHKTLNSQQALWRQSFGRPIRVLGLSSTTWSSHQQQNSSAQNQLKFNNIFDIILLVVAMNPIKNHSNNSYASQHNRLAINLPVQPRNHIQERACLRQFPFLVFSHIFFIPIFRVEAPQFD